MRQLFPVSKSSVDPIEAYAADERSNDTRDPWVMVNMISSLDGATSIDGVSGSLGGPTDKLVFTAIRAVADVILVGAGTVIAENYRTPQTPPTLQRVRSARGQTELPRLAIVSNALSLPNHHRVLDPAHRPLIVTNRHAPAGRREALSEHAEIIEAGEHAVDVGAAIAILGDRSNGVILAEGGPALNGALVDADLVDELCLTVSPLLVGGDSDRIVSRAMASGTRRFRLDRILHDDDLTFLRYLRIR